MAQRSPPAATVDRRRGDGAQGLYLVVLQHGRSHVHRLPAEGEVVVGRDESADIVIDDASVSRRHARLSVERAPESAADSRQAAGRGAHVRVMLTDLRSRNGTRVAGTECRRDAPTPLPVGTVATVGDVTVFVQHGPAEHLATLLSGGGPPTRDPDLGRAARDEPPAKSGAGTGTRAERVAESHARAGSAEHVAEAESAAGRPVVFRDKEMLRIVDLLRTVAPSDIAVLLLGETGVGKDVLAELVHYTSHRAGGPYMRINCAALSESLLESELFGHEKGAFTGAVSARAGLFEAANGGTVFLDELGEMPLSTQAKLLRVLENREVVRLGSTTPRRIDVRFVSATNQELENYISEKRFRADLFYRVSGISVRVPSLRERRADVVPLAEMFLAELAARAKRPLPHLTPDDRMALERHPWPGNVRELRNAMERHLATGGKLPLAAALGSTGTQLGARPKAAQREAAAEMAERGDATPPPLREAVSLPDTVAEVEVARIRKALEDAHGNQTRAAELLGITRRALVYRLEMYGFPRPRRR